MAKAKKVKKTSISQDELDNKFKEFSDKVRKKQYLELTDFDYFNLDYKVLILMAKKNVGKTYQMMQLFKDCVSRKSKFILMRLMDIELKNLEKEWNNDSSIPFFIKNGKEIYLKDVDNMVCHVNKTTHVGKAIAFKSISQYGSMQFNDYDLIVFDEFMPQNERDERLLYPIDRINNFFVFLSNVERNKPDLKVYMFGNFLTSNNQLLQTLQFNYDANIKWDDDTKILIINTFSLYQGIINQTITQGFLKFAPMIKNALENNVSLTSTERKINITDFYQLDRRFGIMFDLANIIYFRSKKIPIGDNRYFMLNAIHRAGYYDDEKIYTPAPQFANAFKNVLYHEDLYNDLIDYADLMIHKRLFYTDLNVLDILSEFLNKKHHKAKF